MGLHITTKGKLAMLLVIELGASQNASRADMAGYSSLRGKSINPHGGKINEFNQHQGGNESEGERMACCSDSLFDDADLAFNLGYVLISRGHI